MYAAKTTYPCDTPRRVCQRNASTAYPGRGPTARGTKGGPSPTDGRTKGDHVPRTTTSTNIIGTTNSFGQQSYRASHPTNQTTNPSTKNEGKYPRRATSHSALSPYSPDISTDPISTNRQTNSNQEEKSTAVRQSVSL
jgi:hypothetical protein